MSSSSDDEGVIKYRAHHTPGRLPDLPADVVTGLSAWRRVLFDLALIGQDKGRYGGAGFGNIGAKLGAGTFVITGTQTGGIRDLPVEGFSVVTRVSITTNEVWSRGPIVPSSESMTHAAIYKADPLVTCIFHVHSPDIWRKASALGLPQTRASVPYGTVEMAREIARLFDETTVRRQRALSMAGHEDGVVTFGANLDEAGTRMVSILARAHMLA